MNWEVILEPEDTAWILDLPDDTNDRIEVAIDILAQTGPGLGRPLVDAITGSRPPEHEGTTRRNLPDPVRLRPRARTSILLVAGDKRGNWRTWYPPAIALAEQRFDNWLTDLKGSAP